MKFKDLREFIRFLEDKGELRRITAPVNHELEITEITDRVIKSGGPALLFENVTGFDTPVLVNMYGTEQRTAWALGVESLDALTGRVEGLLDLMHDPPQGLMGKLKALGQLVHLASFQPKTVNNAPCQEVVIQGSDVDLYRFPILKCWPLDGGPFITLPLVVTKDPETGVQNYGTYRMQVYDKQTTGMHWQTHKVGTHHYRLSHELGLEKLDVSVALGGDPATIWTGSAPLPPDMDEMAIAGFLREEGVELVRSKTNDLLVPAQAEIVLEGYVVPGEERDEGPFGDHTGYYSMEDPYPVFHVTCITQRKEPIYPAALVGRPPMEDYWMGKVTERVFLPLMKLVLPEVVDINMPAEGSFHNLVIVSIKKEFPGHGKKVMHGLWGLGLMSLVKTIIVVDHNVDVHNMSEVAWRVTNNIDPSQDFVFSAGPIDDLDIGSSTRGVGGKVGIDATIKLPLEGGRQGEWPPDIIMDQVVKDLVDGKWSDYGLA
ncbi:MAG: menaquinone biosynthesis decarboxylase [Dehalococcoidia bacterium]|jgi:4-hydroxy-3-polyprenylbenzoate decarboxylase|nr:MAG: menaquinone biosynthesis decarboxylase [Dehalococcoidia bacterium]PKB81480.1 MAG: menaquinone biosynthesis decarboxylase [SAR202 cluster bacterium MP-SInd-SRR3963457-G1]PKB84969.1 MAG: menaquinone biosynthesis decarboxylase [SAR202 cluster bacterium MP-NPac-SRR3961935-G1]HIM63405.1 menaquinone biosynthesis decarboxylase [Dehalococcoidia bacterium]HIN25413.1 menaquinone biosynthesis decarboxylase [Dehalococcoidia bacterium]